MRDDTLSRWILVAAGIAGAIGVIMGSLAAHGLSDLLLKNGMPEDLIEKRVSQFDVGVRYQMYHSVALLALASIPFGSPKSRRFVAAMFFSGIFLFSGSLYALVFMDEPKLGAITPFGGLCWIIGWLGLILVAYRRRRKQRGETGGFEVSVRENQ